MYLINKDETEHTGQVRRHSFILNQSQKLQEVLLVHHLNPLVVLHKSEQEEAAMRGLTLTFDINLLLLCT